MLSRSQPATRHSAARASGRARAMNTATGSVRSLPQARSCRKHSPRQCRSPSQPGTEHGSRCSGRVARGGGAASKSAQHTPAPTRARRQPSQRPDGRRVAVGQPGVRHGHAAVRAQSRSPVNSSVSSSHSPARQAGSSRARSHATQPFTVPLAASRRPAGQPAARARSPVPPPRRDGFHRAAFVLVAGVQVNRRRGQRGVTEQRLHHVQIDTGPDPVRGRRVAQHVGPDREPAPVGQPVKEALRRPVASSARRVADGRG